MKKDFLTKSMWLLTLFVLWAGFLSTNSYYAMFGVPYSNLALDFNHIVFRGVSIVLGSLSAAGFFALIVLLSVVLSLDSTLVLGRMRVPPYLYGPVLLVISFLILTYTVFSTSRDLARKDMFESSTTLPQLIAFNSTADAVTESMKKQLAAGTTLVLYHKNERMILFKAPAVEVDGIPNIRVRTILLHAGDVYDVQTR